MAKSPLLPKPSKLSLDPEALRSLNQLYQGLKDSAREMRAQKKPATSEGVKAAAQASTGQALTPEQIKTISAAAIEAAKQNPQHMTQAAVLAAQQVLSSVQMQQVVGSTMAKHISDASKYYGAGQSPTAREAVESAIAAAVKRTAGGPAEQAQAADRAGRMASESGFRQLEIQSVVDRYSDKFHGSARANIQSAAERAGASVHTDNHVIVSKAAEAAAARTARQYTSGYTQSQERLHQQASVLSGLGMHGMAGTMQRVGGAAQSMEAMGVGGGGAALSKLAGPIAAAMAMQGAIEMGGRTAAMASSPWTTNAQIRRSVISEIPVVGWGQRMVEQYGGRAGKYEEVHQKAQYAEYEMHGQSQRERFDTSFRPQQLGLEARAHAYRTGSAVTMPNIDRSASVIGEREYAIAQKMLPLRERAARAEKDMAAATAERLGTENKLSVINNKIEDAKKKQAAIEAEIERRQDGPEGVGASHQKLLIEGQQNAARIKDLSLQKQETDPRAVESRKRQAQAEADLRQAKIAVEYGEKAERQQSQYESAKSLAGRLGRMDPLQRQWSASMYEQAKNLGPKGLDLMPAEWRQHAEQFNPEGMSKLYEQRGEQTPEFRRAQQLGEGQYGEAGKGLKEQQTEADKTRKEAAEKGYEVEKRLAEKNAEAGKNLAIHFAAAVKAFVDAAKQEFDNKMRQSKN